MAAVSPASIGLVLRFRRTIVGVLALSLLVSCSRTPSAGTAEDAKPKAAAAGPVEVKPEALLAPLEADGPARDEALAARPPPAKAGSKAKVPISSAPSGALDGRGLSGVSGGAGMAHRAHARKALAPAPTATAAPLQRDAEMNTENYAHVAENPFLAVKNQPLSTFSVDVDTASYANSRRFLAQGSLPPKDAIRIEEWINYFAYDYAQPTGSAPFGVVTEVTSCPWNDAHKLVRIGIKGREMSAENVPPRNLVFLLDVSGSMMSADKLPLVKRGMAMLTDALRPQDTIAIVVYAGNSGLVLPATSGRERGKILRALESLEAGGSTNGGAGIQLAYQVAQQQFKKGGINRVILASDGDFNVGTTSEGELTRLIEEKRKSGVFLTVLGLGTGNTKDATMEMLADKGNGNYAYIDTLTEARKVLVREAGSTLVTIAKDVKLQVEFNPTKVQSYKLIGYENRLLAKEDFNDDKKDAGEIGAGHTVTALYEIVPVGATTVSTPKVDALKYQGGSAPSAAAASGELMTVNVRYKPPQGDVSTKLSVVVVDDIKPIVQASNDYRFSVAVANAALLLRGSKDLKQSSLESAQKLAAGALGQDPHGDRREFLAMLDEAKRLRGGQTGVLKSVAR
ncbi:MAG TPA: VWA domain-containing protein [Polyangiaceae bacterium]|nr:VWA domain-containing protein [Polyangiaceae bacterium]